MKLNIPENYSFLNLNYHFIEDLIQEKDNLIREKKNNKRKFCWIRCNLQYFVYNTIENKLVLILMIIKKNEEIKKSSFSINKEDKNNENNIFK